MQSWPLTNEADLFGRTLFIRLNNPRVAFPSSHCVLGIGNESDGGGISAHKHCSLKSLIVMAIGTSGFWEPNTIIGE